MSALFIGAGTALVGTAYTIENSESQKHKANEIEKNLKQPNYAIPPEFIENRNIAKQMAQLGLPQQQYNNQFNQIQGNLATGISAAQRSNNPAGAISGVVSGTNTAGANLNAEDAQARQNNQRIYMQANDQLAGQKLQQQQANVFDPYTQKYNEMQAYRGAGQQNINSGIGDISKLGGLAMQYGLGNQNIPQQFTNPQAGQAPLTAQGTGVQPMQFQNQIPGQQPVMPYGTGWTSWG